MHKWADLIPYYVAGTLSRKEAADLERHLAGCEKCRMDVQEWQTVAGVVRHDAQRWASQTPQVPQGVITAAFSSNGHGATGVEEMQTMRMRPMQPRPASLVTIAAAVAVLLIGGMLMLFLASHPDSSSRGAPPKKTGTPTKAAFHAYTQTPNSLKPPTFTPISGTPYPTSTPLRLTASPLPLIAPSPTARYGSSIGLSSYNLITLAQINQIPANTFVRIASAWYDGTAWVYTIMASSGQTGYARDWQLGYGDGAPVGTPTARYSAEIGIGGYSMITLEQVGTIPANTRVRIGSAQYTGSGWLYDIYSLNEEAYAQAREDQITYAPGVMPGPTATSPFDNAYGYSMITLEQVGAIPANTTVSIGSASYDRIDGWTYIIITRDGVSATARQNQITYAPGVTPGPIPPNQFCNCPANYALITVEQVGQIPANSRVMIVNSWYDSLNGWIYTIQAQGSQITADAYEHQLTYAPNITPGPTPTAQFFGLGTYDYPLSLTESVGAIQAGEPIQVVSATFDAVDGWIYTVQSQDGTRSAEVPERLITYPSANPSTCPYTTTLTRDCPDTQFQTQAAYMTFERGYMIWRGDTQQIYVLYFDRNVYETYSDTWSEGETIPDDGQQPPAGMFRPGRGFGKVWATQPNVRAGLGWATGSEAGYTTTIEMFNFNVAMTLPSGQVMLLEELPPIWTLVP